MDPEDLDKQERARLDVRFKTRQIINDYFWGTYDTKSAARAFVNVLKDYEATDNGD